MEAEERPSKVRKLSHASDVNNELLTLPSEELSGEGSHSAPQQKSIPSQNLHYNDRKTSLSSEGGVLLDNPFSAYASDVSQFQVAALPLSKNQFKKLKRKEDWEAGREARKQKRRKKDKEKRQRKRDAVANENGPAPAQSSTEPPALNVQQKNVIAKVPNPPHGPAVQLPITFIFDCGFDTFMTEKERISLAAQLTRCYADNHRSTFRAHLAISSFGGLLKQRFDTVLSRQHENWKGVRFIAEDFTEVAEQAKAWMSDDQGGALKGRFAAYAEGNKIADAAEAETVYLTSDSPDTLTELKPYSTYIIGGLVDKNRHKGICYKKAMDHGMKTAKLPIGEYMEMTTRTVLAVNHVCEIMLKWLVLKDWGEAFLKVVPKRKGGVLKGSQDRPEDALLDDELDVDTFLEKMSKGSAVA